MGNILAAPSTSIARRTLASHNGPRARSRINVAAHFVFTGRVGGAEHMLYNLLRGMWNSADVTVLCAAASNLNAGFAQEVRNSARLREVGGNGSRFLAEQRACLAATTAGDAILFPNYFVPPLTPRRLGRVVTVLHDMQYRHFPQYFAPKKRAWLRAAHALAFRKADNVVAISSFVRDDALRWLGQDFANKITVIPNAVEWTRFDGSLGNRRPFDGRYVLSVAAQYPHKNLETLIRAFAQVARQQSDLHLVLCGQDYSALRGVASSRAGLLPLGRELGIADRLHLTGYVDDAALGAWYRGASLFAFPSVFEGFGMPPVEALGFGLPVLTTSATALPEVTRGLAYHVDDPFSVTEWASKLVEMLANPGRYRPTDDEAAALRRFYHPDRIAEQYLNLCLL